MSHVAWVCDSREVGPSVSSRSFLQSWRGDLAQFDSRSDVWRRRVLLMKRKRCASFDEDVDSVGIGADMDLSNAPQDEEPDLGDDGRECT